MSFQEDFVEIDSPGSKIRSAPLLDRGDEKKASKRWQDCPMRDLAPTRCPAHLCLPVFPSLSHLSLLLFPFSLSRPQARRSTTFSLFPLSLCRAISSLLYTVPRNHTCEFQHCKARKIIGYGCEEIFYLNLEKKKK